MFNFLSLTSIEITMVIIWAIIAIAAIVIEFETANLVSIWFAAGGIAGIIGAIVHFDIWLQIILFVAVSAVFVLGTRPFVKKISDNQTILTNADRLVGMIAVVTKQIKEGEKGKIKVDFQEWPAISTKGETFEVNDKLVISNIVVNKMIVEKIKEIKLD